MCSLSFASGLCAPWLQDRSTPVQQHSVPGAPPPVGRGSLGQPCGQERTPPPDGTRAATACMRVRVRLRAAARTPHDAPSRSKRSRPQPTAHGGSGRARAAGARLALVGARRARAALRL
eukprot:679198-Prymnesium_polylepis.1